MGPHWLHLEPTHLDKNFVGCARSSGEDGKNASDLVPERIFSEWVTVWYGLTLNILYSVGGRLNSWHESGLGCVVM
jgi:hypothetical protein